MAAAQIVIDQTGAPAGSPALSRSDLVLSVPVVLTNGDNTSVRVWRWALVASPPGSTAALTSTVGATTSFTPDIEGSYLIELQVNEGRSGERNRVIAAVLNADGLRFPVSGEGTEFNENGNTQGYGPDLDEILRDATSGGGGVSITDGTTLVAGATTISLDPAFFEVANGGGGIGQATLVSVDGLPGVLSDPQTPDAHETTHRPGGSDAILTAAAVELTDNTNAEGNGTALARNNHTHAHGNRGGGSLHALATTSVAGFLSAVDKTTIDMLSQSTRFEVVRDIDFGSWAATDFSSHADGTTTSLDGGDGAITWTTQNAAAANSASGGTGVFRRNNSDTGADGAFGLRIAHDQSVSTALIAATRSAPRLTTPLSSLIPSFDPFQEYLILVQFNALSSQGTVTTAPAAELVLMDDSEAGVARAMGVSMLWTAAGGNPWQPAAIGTSTFVPFGSTFSVPLSSPYPVVGLSVRPNIGMLMWKGSYSGGWPNPSALTPIAAGSALGSNCSRLDVWCDPTMLIAIGLASRASYVGNGDAMFKRLRVLRKIR